MSLNVPTSITLAQLKRMRFGDVDAAAEDMNLFESVFCMPDWISTFLQGNHTILRGHRGTGKTALFESLKHGVLAYEVPDRHVSIIPIDQTLDYEEVRNHVLPKVQSRSRSPSLKHRVVWEMFILHKIALEISKDEDLPPELHALIIPILSQFGPDVESLSISRLLLSSKRKIGIKLSSSELGVPYADFYFDFSPNETASVDVVKEGDRTINLPIIKAALDDYLAKAGRHILVVIDKLDDFTTGENLTTQRALLQGLLVSERDYRNLKNIELVLLFRSDLLEQIPIEALGSDKFHSRTLHLRWSPNDLRSFIGRRIAYNFFHILDDRQILVNIDPSSLYGAALPSGKLKKFWRSAKGLWARLTKKQTFDHENVRVRNLSEEILGKFIYAFFGSEVEHVDKSGQVTAIPIEKYLDTHFLFSNGEATPRVMLMFCQLVLETAIDYFGKNPDLCQAIKFPLIPPRSTREAYLKLKKKLWDIHADFSKEWKPCVVRLQKKASMDSLQYSDLSAVVGDADVGLFTDYAIRHGLLSCDNDILPLDERIYRFPLLLRSTPGTHG